MVHIPDSNVLHKLSDLFTLKYIDCLTGHGQRRHLCDLVYKNKFAIADPELMN